MQLHPRALAIAAAILGASLYAFGALVHVVVPWGAPAVVAYVFRVDVIDLARPLTWDSFLVGLLALAATGAVLGGLTAWLYNWIVGRAKGP